MMRATKALSIKEEETTTAALGLNCSENDRSQASLDWTEFPKKFWKIENMTPLSAKP